MKKYTVLIIFFLSAIFTNAQDKIVRTTQNADERFEEFSELLQGKRIALLANQTAVIKGKHLLDILLENNVNVVKIFSPEHGFRGKSDAGKNIKNDVDKKTKLPIISLYGNKKKPSADDLKNVDIILYDIQDVGVRFFTYISTLTYAMEACAENDKQLIILDRQNPNGSYVDGPVLDLKYKSFVGMHPVPVVYGMTVGEYATMVNGENWLANNLKCKLIVVPILNYSRKKTFSLNEPPSPNLNSDFAVALYPSLCLFEGTNISVGRGTKMPFTIYGHPQLLGGDYYYTPKSIKNMSVNPPHKNQKCRGYNLNSLEYINLFQFNLEYIINAYKYYPEKNNFFNNFFNNLAGNDILKQQIMSGKPIAEIRESWKKDLEKFVEIRKKYLLYAE